MEESWRWRSTVLIFSPKSTHSPTRNSDGIGSLPPTLSFADAGKLSHMTTYGVRAVFLFIVFIFLIVFLFLFFYFLLSKSPTKKKSKKKKSHDKLAITIPTLLYATATLIMLISPCWNFTRDLFCWYWERNYLWWGTWAPVDYFNWQNKSKMIHVYLLRPYIYIIEF